MSEVGVMFMNRDISIGIQVFICLAQPCAPGRHN